jgi:hypothetical protein
VQANPDNKKNYPPIKIKSRKFLFLFICVAYIRKRNFLKPQSGYSSVRKLITYVICSMHTTGYRIPKVMHFILTDSDWNTMYFVHSRQSKNWKLKRNWNPTENHNLNCNFSGGAPQQSIKGQPILQHPMRCRPFFFIRETCLIPLFVCLPGLPTLLHPNYRLWRGGLFSEHELVITLGYELQFQHTRLSYLSLIFGA